MALIEVPSGLEGVIAFDTSIAEPDKEGGALRYRGVDIEELVGKVPYEKVWGLLVDGQYEPGLPPAEPHPLAVRTGDPRVDLQSALAMLAPEWGLGQLIDITEEQARLAEQPMSGLPDHDAREDEQQRGLGQRHDALDLAVAVMVLLVRGLAGDADREIGHQRRAEIDQ